MTEKSLGLVVSDRGDGLYTANTDFPLQEQTEAEVAALRAGVNLAFGELAKLRQATALAKVPLVIEHVRAVLEDTGGKVVVFAHHRAVVAEQKARNEAGEKPTIQPLELIACALARLESGRA